MVMRWLIRGVCLVLLAGVVGVWVGSYAGWLVMYKRSAGRYWVVGAVQGLGFMDGHGNNWDMTTPFLFGFFRGQTAKSLSLSPRTLGFFGGQLPGIPDSWLIIFPLWLPTLLLVALNGLVWRWTRRRKVGVGAEPADFDPIIQGHEHLPKGLLWVRAGGA